MTSEVSDSDSQQCTSSTEAQAGSGMSNKRIPEPSPPPCHFCTVQMKHPWHDNGTEGPDLSDYFKDGANGTPVFFKKENGYQ